MTKTELHLLADCEVEVVSEFDKGKRQDTTVKLWLDVEISGEDLQDFLENMTRVILDYRI